jgi:hypothetical protein
LEQLPFCVALIGRGRHFATIRTKTNRDTASKPHASVDAFTLSRMSIDPTPDRFFHVPAPKRWIALLIASVLLHFMLIGWISINNMGVSSSRDQAPATITAQLHQVRPSEPPAPPKPKPSRPKVTKPTPIPAAPSESVATTHSEGAPSLPSGDITKIDLADASAAFLAIENGIPDEVMPASEILPNEHQQSAAADKLDVQHYKVSIPPSAELKYDVQALRDGQMVYGSGKISWQSDGGNYTVNGEAGILFFTLLNFKSAGVIDDFGVAPVMYSEKRFRRPETNTHFHRERNTISFSASTVIYPRKGGEQDRASIIWQLTGIGRGDGEKFKPGAEIDFFVAGVRDAAPWRVRVIGEEQIEVGSEKITAWHVVRIPKQGSYDQKLDIWLSPQHEWYPVKLRFTETNGEYLDMLLSNLTMSAAN